MALGSALAALAFAGAAAGIILANRTLALAVPVLFAGAFACSKAPAIPIALAVLFSGMIGTIVANFSALPTQGSADVLLLCLTLAVIGSYLIGRRQRELHIWPGLAGFTFFGAITAVSIVLSKNVSLGYSSFRQQGWYMLAVTVIAFAPWSKLTFQRIAKAIVVAGLVVAGFSAFRYATGSTAAETAAARSITSVPYSTPLRFFGTFLSAQELGAWCAVMMPFCTALALTWRGRWRWAAVALLILSVVDLLASDVRTAVAAGVGGVLLAMVLFVLARAFPSGQRAATGLISIVAVIVVGVGAIAVTGAAKSSNESTSSLQALLHPNSDPNYQIRKQRWDAAWKDVTDEPFGHGLGTTGTIASQHGLLPIGPTPLDSSYLKVGIEQGLVLMILFIAVLVLLVLSLCRYAVVALERQQATFAIGAAGTLAAMMVLFYGSLYASQPSVVVTGWLIVGLGAAGFTTFAPRRTGETRQPR